MARRGEGIGREREGGVEKRLTRERRKREKYEDEGEKGKCNRLIYNIQLSQATKQLIVDNTGSVSLLGNNHVTMYTHCGKETDIHSVHSICSCSSAI